MSATYDAINWDWHYDGEGNLVSVQLRATPLPVAPKTDVRSGVEHLDGVGDVAVPAAADVRSGVAVDHTVGTLVPGGGGGELIDVAFEIALDDGDVIVSTDENFSGTVEAMSAGGGAFETVGTLTGPGSVTLSLDAGAYYLRMVNSEGYTVGARVDVPADVEPDAFESDRWEQRIASRPTLVNYSRANGSGGWITVYGVSCYLTTDTRSAEGEHRATSELRATLHFIASGMTALGIVPAHGDAIEVIDTGIHYGVEMAVLKHHGAVWQVTCVAATPMAMASGRSPI